jgi:ATP-dependent DNA helicase DinG
VAWLKTMKRHLRFQWTPFSVAKETQALISSLDASLIFTSATLKTQGHFTWFQSSLGLEDARVEAWESPYAWDKQALMYLPHGLPDVYHPRYYQELLSQVLPVIHLLGGKTLFLFTSHRALTWVAEHLPKLCHYPLLIQGQADKSELLAQFRQQSQSILLGTGSFWEGVDMQGDCLSCVIIDKLPFANIAEPWIAAKLNYLQQQGQSVFDEYLIPQAILTLKQGVGRLIRTETDRGVLIIGDPRLYGRQYGKDFKQSLPPIPWTRSFAKVSDFVQSFNHETQDETLVSI